MLTAEQAAIADEAVRKVEAAVGAAQKAIADRSWIWTRLGGSESAAAAERESLRQTEKILAELRGRRPSLEPAGLVGFVELAAAGASVEALIASARQATTGAFVDQVVKPTASGLLSFGSWASLAIAGAVVIYLLGGRRR